MGCGGRELSTIGMSSKIKFEFVVEHPLHFKFLIQSNCSLDTVIGFLKIIHETLSRSGGVVSEPWYVQ